jgi:D-amino-acid oxidase
LPSTLYYKSAPKNLADGWAIPPYFVAMADRIAIVGAGVSGLTCGVTFAEQGYPVAIFADQTGQQTTSGVAAALWYPYDAEPADQVIPWALATYQILGSLVGDQRSGVSMIELRTFSRTGEIQIPDWAGPLGARKLKQSVIPSENTSPVRTEEPLTVQGDIPAPFVAGFALNLPLMDTTIYLDYLAQRFVAAGGEIHGGVRLGKLEDVSPDFDLVVNCAGIGAKTLACDLDLEPHRGQVVIVSKIDGLGYAMVCDDAPLMYAIPRANDCVLGGTNEISNDCGVDPAATSRILTECSLSLNINQPKVLAERVGLRPFRKSGVRVDRGQLDDGRPVIHNYGHGGSGFTLSGGCAQKVLALARAAVVGSV